MDVSLVIRQRLEAFGLEQRREEERECEDDDCAIRRSHQNRK